MASMGGKIYLVGGHNQTISTVSSAERFRPDSRRWERLPPMRCSRAHAASAVLSGKLYVCGGNDGSETLHTVERFNPLTTMWEDLPPMLGRRWIAAAVVLAG